MMELFKIHIEILERLNCSTFQSQIVNSTLNNNNFIYVEWLSLIVLTLSIFFLS